ncbi:MAG: protein-ADP-ribose hydrolase [Clostridia bacterium]|nr:protein-ADP-ribose hydrolase [Clostridia bacterium]
MEKIDYLIEYLLKESGRENFDYNNREKKSLYRALVNVRQANPISEKFLKAEDEYLQEELEKQGITKVDDIKANNKIALWQGDITKLKIEAIVNAGNSQGLGCFVPNHNCIDNQINTFAGVRLRLACNEIMKDLKYNLETGKVIITKGYNLPCKYVIQTVGPIVKSEVTEQKEKELKNCYINSLKLAVDNGIKTIAFPCISTGVFRFPKDRACEIAIKSVKDFFKENNKIEKVVFNVYSDEDLEIYKNELK